MRHLIDTDDLSDKQLESILSDAFSFKANNPPPLLANKIMVTLFFEDSTRTRSSFEIAGKRLGMGVVTLNSSTSSTNKGETLYDTFTTIGAMEPDTIVIRASQNSIPQKLSKLNLTPVINAGAGNYAHPSQALLDLMTLKEHFGDVRGKTIAIVGDIVTSRVAASAIRVLERVGMNIILVGPKEFLPPISFIEGSLPQYNNLEYVIDKVDVIMSLRVQLERHPEPIFEDYNDYASQYCITKELIADRDIVILHPGPVMRNIDISDEVLEDKRCKVLTQVKNGLYIRMAILKNLILDS
ncbi:Aspartate carbamoyltransferase [hydrothermal vent metagenome]|uniref:aspartate carbamoyltransferase n=1 Tax=hydrothermal vent metagenome TaxID=652676 RepID=A0A1W1EJT9_9ZZZZ